MANTKTTTTRKTTTSAAKPDVKLLEKIESQQKQIDELMKIITTMNQSKTEEAIVQNNVLGADEEVPVISLVPNKLNLVTDSASGSIVFSFDKMYEEQLIDYATLKEIVRANRTMAKNGRFYIMDERAVNNLRLKNDYKSILTPDQLKTILDKDIASAVELYKLAPDGQKGVIIDMVKQKKFSGGGVDYNLLQQLSELCGIDLVAIEDATQIKIEE